MKDLYITHIHINQVRHLENFDIPLSQNQRKHLVLTGKNGSGKTSVLEALNNFIVTSTNHYPSIPDKQVLVEVKSSIEEFVNSILTNKLFFVFFKANRKISFIKSNSIQKTDLIKSKTTKKFGALSNANSHQYFIQYLVNQKADRSFARDDGDLESVKEIDQWFAHFEQQLFEIFGIQHGKLVFHREDYSFTIKNEDTQQEFNLHELPDGFASILGIVAELMLRMELQGIKGFNAQGIVLIDEIETHLHIDLQKKILPFLTGFFPNIQFIVSTHSPFVINSIRDAVVCDLEKRIVVDEDLTDYSYEAIVESYFDSDKYSNILKKKVEQYENLMNLKSPNDEEKEQLRELEIYLESAPKVFADELAVKLQQIKLKHLKPKQNPR